MIIIQIFKPIWYAQCPGKSQIKQSKWKIWKKWEFSNVNLRQLFDSKMDWVQSKMVCQAYLPQFLLFKTFFIWKWPWKWPNTQSKVVKMVENNEKNFKIEFFSQADGAHLGLKWKLYTSNLAHRMNFSWTILLL